jgi:hypothetical protein
VSSLDHSKNLSTLLKKLRSRYDVPEVVARPPLEEFVYSFLLWEASHAKAEAALKRITSSVVDFNELRVCRPPELISFFGKSYPRAEERSLRMRAALQDLYLREYEVSLNTAVAMNKRDAKKYIETLNGLPSFVSSRVLLLSFGAHALPVDDRTLHKLIAAEVVEHGSDVMKAAGVLERHVKAEEGAEVHGLLQQWSEDSSADPAPKDKGGKAAGSKPRAPAKTSRASKG